MLLKKKIVAIYNLGKRIGLKERGVWQVSQHPTSHLLWGANLPPILRVYLPDILPPPMF